MALIDKLKAIADAIRTKTGETQELSLDDMVTAITGISTGGSGGGSTPLSLELIGEYTTYLEEYTDTLNEEKTTTNINISSTDYAFIITTIVCDGVAEGPNDWGGITIDIGGRFKTNSAFMTTGRLYYRGAKSLFLSENTQNATVNIGYGVVIPTNINNITFARKCHGSSCPKIMAGNYTVRAYGVKGV